MAVDVGKAEGKLTLDASAFISELTKANDALKEFKHLTEEVQTSFSGLQDASASSGGFFQQIGFDPSVFREVYGENNALINALDPSPVNQTNTAFQALSSTLKGGFTTAVKGTANLVKTTFDVFVKFAQKTLEISKQSLQIGMAFDAGMSKVMSIVGDVSDEALEGMKEAADEMGLAYEENGDAAAVAMDILRSKALEMGAQTRFTASQAADALSYMAMAGWKGEQMLEGLGGIMSLAAASGEDLATTSDIVTDALTAFGLTAEDSQHFADVLAQASSNSNTNVGLMGETFKYVASMAGTMKYSIEDTAVAIGLMANTGIKGSQAGTALRNIISNLAKPSNTVSTAMDKLGLSLADEEGHTKSLMEVMKDLRKSFADLSNDKNMEEYAAAIDGLNTALDEGRITEEEYEEESKAIAATLLKSTDSVKAEYAAMISGKYGLSGLLAIVNASEEDFNKLAEAIYNAEGAAGRMENVQMGNLQGSVDKLKSTYESLQISISDLLKGTVTEFTQSITAMIGNMVQSVKEEGFIGLFKEIGRILPQFISLILPKIPEILDTLLAGFWTLINGVIDIIPDALPKLVEAAIQLFMGLVTGLTESSDKLFNMLPGVIRDIVSILINHIDELITGALELFLGLVVGLAEATPDLLKAVLKLLPKIVEALLLNLNLVLDAGMRIILALAEALLSRDGINAILESCKNILIAIKDAFSEVDWLETAQIIFGGLGDGLLMVFQGALELIDEIFGTNLSQWGQQVAQFVDGVKIQSFEMGKTMAESMNKTEIELNELESKYFDTYQDMLEAYKKYVAAGADTQDAMAKAYQEMFTSAEAQYVFRNRFASDLAGLSSLGMEGASAQEITNRLEQPVTNVYNFYTNEPIDEKKAAQEIEQTQKDLVRGF